MTKDKIICKNFYEIFNQKYNITTYILKEIIFEGYLFNEFLNETEKIKYYLINFKYQILYEIKHLFYINNDFCIDTLIQKTLNVIRISNNISNIFIYKDYDKDDNENTHLTLILFLFLQQKKIYYEYQNYFKEYLYSIEDKLEMNTVNYDKEGNKIGNKNIKNTSLLLFENLNGIPFLIDTNFTYNYKYINNDDNNDNSFLRIQLKFNYKINKNHSKIKFLNKILNNTSYSIKRNAYCENNNIVKNYIQTIKELFINDILTIF